MATAKPTRIVQRSKASKKAWATRKKMASARNLPNAETLAAMAETNLQKKRHQSAVHMHADLDVMAARVLLLMQCEMREQLFAEPVRIGNVSREHSGKPTE